MKRIGIIVVVGVILSGCVQFMDEMLLKMDGIPNKRAIDHEWIDQGNPLQEHEVIVKTMETQRDILKLGFITEEYEIAGIEISYFTYSDDYLYHVRYHLPGVIPRLAMEGGKYYNDIFYDKVIKDFENPKELDHDRLKGYYGLHGDGEYYDLWAQDEDITYNVGIGNNESLENEQLLEWMAKSMKTEEDGAYEPLYDHFSLDPKKWKFPHFNEEYIDIESASVSISGYDELNSSVSITYRLEGPNVFYYTIYEKERELSDYRYKRESEKETTNGLTVTEYKGINNDDYLYRWTDDIHYYELEFWAPDKNVVKREDVYEIVDSAMQDNRTFKDEEIFAPINEGPIFTENEEKITKLLKES